jgi:hypothetical protein
MLLLVIGRNCRAGSTPHLAVVRALGPQMIKYPGSAALNIFRQ